MKLRSTIPVRLFDERSNHSSPTNFDKNFGRGPSSLLKLTSISLKLEDILGYNRKFPVRLFWDRLKNSKEGRENKDAGITPLMELLLRSIAVRLRRAR